MFDRWWWWSAGDLIVALLGVVLFLVVVGGTIAFGVMTAPESLIGPVPVLLPVGIAIGFEVAPW